MYRSHTMNLLPFHLEIEKIVHKIVPLKHPILILIIMLILWVKEL